MATLNSVNATDHQADLVIQPSLRLVADNPSQEFEMISPSLVDTHSQDWATIYVDSDHLDSKEAAKNAKTSPHASTTSSWYQTACLRFSPQVLDIFVEYPTQSPLLWFHQSTYQSLNTCTPSGGLKNPESTTGWKSLKACNPVVPYDSIIAIRDDVVPHSTTWPISSVTTSENTSDDSIAWNLAVALDSLSNGHWKDTLLSNIKRGETVSAPLSNACTHAKDLHDKNPCKSISVESTESDWPLTFREHNSSLTEYNSLFVGPNSLCMEYNGPLLRDVLSAAHTLLVWSYSMDKVQSSGTSLDDTINPRLDRLAWGELGDLLNELRRILSIECTESEEEVPKTLSEDYLIRGLVWSQSDFPTNWFSYQAEDESRYLEPTAMHQARVERVQYLSLFLASHTEYLEFDKVDIQFGKVEIHQFDGFEIRNLHRSISTEKIILTARRPKFIAQLRYRPVGTPIIDTRSY